MRLLPTIDCGRQAPLARKTRIAIGLASTLLLVPIAWAAVPPTLELAAEAGRPTQLKLDSREIPLQKQGGGFSIIDFKTGRTLRLLSGAVDRHPDGTQTYRAMADSLTLEATFSPQKDGSVRVHGLLKNATAQDRAIVLRYLVPMKTEGALFGYDPGGTQRVGPDSEKVVVTIFPVAAMAQGDACAALAIPPTFPSCFGMRGTQTGLAVEFYLGLAPETKRFPNQAGFEFLIYGALPAWPFRSALARYFEMAPEYFATRIRGGGFWNKHEPGNIDAALPIYRYQVLLPREQPAAEIRRRSGFGLLSFDYLLVGNLKIKDLPKVPGNYDAAMQDFAAFTSRESQSPSSRKRPDTVSTTELIQRSACKTANGHYVLFNIPKGDTTAEGDKDEISAKGAKAERAERAEKRNAEAKGHELTFIMNPNPDLFADQGVDTIGSLTMRHAKDVLGAGPIDGFEFDSLGGRWPAHLNYRRDHFPYTRYPLTFDDEGRVAIHNQVSHYECVDTLRTLTHERSKFLFGNGIYTYARKPGADNYEQHNSQQNGRFFLAALLDVLGRENSSLLEKTSLEQMRAMAGAKLFTMAMYKWDDPEFLRVQMNRDLVYAIFGMPSDKASGYINSPAFARDRPLIEWFLKNGRLLQEAGWQPVTDARVSSPDIACERYGKGDTVYFSLANFASETRNCNLTIDLDALSMKSSQGSMPRVQEVARGAKLTTTMNRGECRIQLQLPPNEAHIIQVKR